MSAINVQPMSDAIAYLNSLGFHRVKPGLDRIKRILGFLGNPQDRVPSIIIAGTNGKGSVAATLASVFKAEGYRAGLYTSPHLSRVSERMKADGGEISVSDLSSLIWEIKRIAQHLSIEPSYFEVLTASAFVYFADQKLDLSVLETGMGGRWDATNVVRPLVSVVTNVSRDHTEFLGQTIKEIALEKAGVIKPGVSVITGAKDDALAVIKREAEENSSPLLTVGRDFGFVGESTRDFGYHGRDWSFNHLSFSLAGLHQLENAALAIAALEEVSLVHGIGIKESSLRGGLSSVRWEGRMEYIRNNPPLILDGAHNPAGARALRRSLEASHPGEKFTFLVGMLADKDHEAYFDEISPISSRVIVTRAPSERGVEPDELARVAGQYDLDIDLIPDFKQAFKFLETLNTPSCVTGSLYLIGAIKAMLGGQEFS